MESLSALPEELTLRLLEELSPLDLSARCSTDRNIVRLCADQQFWRQKVRSLSRRQLQYDWILPLARGSNSDNTISDLRLLNHLLDAIDAADIGLDENFVQAAMFAIGADAKYTNRRLYNYISPKSVSRHYHPQAFTILRDNVTQTANILIQAMQTLRLDTMTALLPLHWESSRAGEYLHISWLLEPYLDLLPSPSVLLMCILCDDWNRNTQCIKVLIEDYIVPHLLRKNDLAPLRTYARDLKKLEALTTAYANKHNLMNNQANNFYSLFIGGLVYAGTVQQIDYVLEDDWRYIANELDMAYCENADTFRHIACLMRYDAPSIGFGYICMEPQEWLKWYRSLPNNVNGSEILRETLDSANNDGYYYFHRIVSDATRSDDR